MSMESPQFTKGISSRAKHVVRDSKSPALFGLGQTESGLSPSSRSFAAFMEGLRSEIVAMDALGPDERGSTRGLVYGKLFGITRHTTKSDIISLLEGCNVNLDDMKVDYNRTYMPTGMMIQFPSRYAYDAAIRAINRKARLYKLERADRSQWDFITPYGEKPHLNWNPKLIAAFSCACKWFDDVAKRVLWKEFCKARAPKMMLDLQSSGNHRPVSLGLQGKAFFCRNAEQMCCSKDANQQGAKFHPTEVCPYCKAKLWSMLQAKMVPQSASCRLGSYEDAIEYYVCLNGHVLGICTLSPLSDLEASELE
ncbi:hypothetical protein TEA_000037 [Camellia sinensis var. sinensis]|uniref:Uncharacterized protein n=1 Tax=Camellia sinensis var. sinensis TaxID=542762 RepID=A0A4V3WQC3_CAMSN|nr:hypothetical protein TEA_000037 [Camellia sinensis var. sinensis]